MTGLLVTVARVGYKRPSLLEVVQVGDVRAIGHWRIRNPEGGGDVADLRHRLAAYPGIDLLGLLIGLFGDRQRRILVDPVLVAGHRAQIKPLLCGSASDIDQSVFGFGDPGHGDLAGVPPWPSKHLEIGDREIREP